ncbi:ATP-binding protein [[Mycoplasma] testudinis]|uniref:ATP-binding protein n=1 Tax=[Mycoplasma] testudinis TaxID=33924 RepID=UPI000489BD02|nr:AAA family ATPase [[Mycoplasma] testudinis]
MIQRSINEKILDSIKNYPVTLITGARQVGKSTLCFEIKKKYNFSYVSLDDSKDLKYALEDPELFLKKYKLPLIIDEVQKAPILLEYIAPIVNRTRLEKGSANGMFILTGSHQYKLMKNVTESLAGRISINVVSPLSNNELLARPEVPFEINPLVLSERIQENFSQEKLLEQILRGGYPEVNINKNLKPSTFYENYVKTYVERDVNEIIGIKERDAFDIFLRIIAAESGKELNYSLIAKNVGVNYKTIQSWISILKTSNLVFTLEPYFEFSVVKRIIRRPKIYMNDTGLACYLTGIKDIKTLENHVNKGFLIETYVINEIIKTYNNSNDSIASFYYFRDAYQNEINLVMLANGKLSLIEIKSGTRYHPSVTKAFDLIKSTNYQLGTNAVICNASSVYPLKKGVYIVPISTI